MCGNSARCVHDEAAPSLARRPARARALGHLAIRRPPRLAERSPVASARSPPRAAGRTGPLKPLREQTCLLPLCAHRSLRPARYRSRRCTSRNPFHPMRAHVRIFSLFISFYYKYLLVITYYFI